MRQPQIVHGLLRFNQLDAPETPSPIYTLGWRFKENDDEWTRRFMRVKDDQEADVVAAKVVTCLAVQKIIEIEDLSPRDTGITVALGHQMEQLEESSTLGKIGKFVAAKTGAAWLNTLLTKKPHKALKSLLQGAVRDREVSGKYSSECVPEISSIIVIDDLLTRGATMAEIRRAITLANPQMRIIGFALAKNESREYALEHGYAASNCHIQPRIENYWNAGINHATSRGGFDGAQ